MAPFHVALAQMREQAAVADADEHMRLRGKYECMLYVVNSLLSETRKRLTRDDS